MTHVIIQIWDTDYGDNSINTTVADLTSLWPDVSPLALCNNVKYMHVRFQHHMFNLKTHYIMQYDWQAALTALFKAAGVDILPTDKVTVTSPSYFRKLTTLIRNTSVT